MIPSSSLATLKYKDIFLVPSVAAKVKQSPMKASVTWNPSGDNQLASTGSSV